MFFSSDRIAEGSDISQSMQKKAKGYDEEKCNSLICMLSVFG